MPRSKQPLVFSGLFIITTILTWWGLGLTYNHTPSVPAGIWIAAEIAPKAPGIGTVVRTCLDPLHQAEYRERGFLRWGLECDGSEALLKPVGALAGALYSVSEKGITLNGKLIPDTAPLKQGGDGQPLRWAGGGIVPPGHVFLVSQWPTSLDSRYFGPVAIARIQASMRPLWTWQ